MIYKCACGNTKSGQPFKSSSVSVWVCSSNPKCQRKDSATALYLLKQQINKGQVRHGPQYKRLGKNVA